MFHGCPPSPDAWGRLTSEPRFIIYRGTATFTPCSERGPLRHLVLFERVNQRERLPIPSPSPRSGINPVGSLGRTKCRREQQAPRAREIHSRRLKSRAGCATHRFAVAARRDRDGAILLRRNRTR